MSGSDTDTSRSGGRNSDISVRTKKQTSPRLASILTLQKSVNAVKMMTTVQM